jgi:hypothetical protein
VQAAIIDVFDATVVEETLLCRMEEMVKRRRAEELPEQ